MDRRIDLTEFEKAVPQMEKWGVTITDAKVTFNEIDKNGGGSILFDEFIDFATKKNLDIESAQEKDCEVD